MLSFQSQPDLVKEMQNIINSGKFFSVTFIKKDGSIRYVNGHKIIYQSSSPSSENRGKFDRLTQNILLVWDNNRVNDLTGEKGQYISVKLERLLFFKAGQFIRDFTEENTDAIRAAKITPEQIEQIKTKMKIDGIIQEEIQNFYEITQQKNNLQKNTAELLGIPELAEYLSRVDPNLTPENMIGMMQQEFQQGGDEAIRKFFYEQSNGIDLQILSRGKYAFKY